MKSFTDYLNEKMDPRDHAVERDGKFVVVDKDGETVKTFEDKAAAEKYAVANHDKLMEGCGCDGTNEDVSSKDAGRIGAAISNRKDLPASEKNVARRSLQRKVARAQRREKAFNVNADSGSRYRVGTKRPADPNNPKHKELVRSRAVSRSIDKDRKAGYSTEAVKPAMRMGVDFKYKAPSDAEKAAMKREKERLDKMRSTPDTSAAGRAAQRMIDARKKTEESVELEEAKAKDIVKGLTDMDGPFTVVAIKNNKVIKQENTKMRNMLPAIVKMMRKEVGVNVTIGIEDRKGTIRNTFKEDVEQVDELSAKALKKYRVKSIKDREDAVRQGYNPNTGQLDPEAEKRRKKRLAGFSRAKRKLVAAEDVEQVDESAGKFREVLNKGKKLGDWNMMSYFLYDGNVWMLQSGRAVNQGKLEVFKKKAQKGLLNSLKFEETDLKREDVEQVDELRVKTLRSYISKAQKDNTQRVTRMADKPDHMPADKDEMRKLRKRQKGVVNAKTDIAMRRIAGKDYRKRMGEDVEQVDELKMPKGGLEKGTFKNPALMLKLLTTGGKGKRKRKVEEEKKDKIKVKLDPKKKIGYEVRSVGPGGKTTVTKRRDMPGQEDVGEASAAWQRKEGKNKEGGLNAAGRASYERENPGSDLKAPVSAEQAKKSKGGKAAKRRKSFCARMGGMPGAMKDEKGRPTRKALALRKWDC